MIFIGNDFGKAFDIGRKLTDRAFFASVTLKVCKFSAGNYMFKVNNRNTRIKYEICLKFVLVSILLTLNIFHTLF